MWILSMCLGYDAIASDFALDYFTLGVTFALFALSCAMSGVMLV